MIKKLKWFDYGESSLTLLAVYVGLDKESPQIPYDSGDFSRCVHLIKCLGLNLEQEKSLLHNTANQYSIWKPYVKKWGKLMRLYNEDRFNGTYKLYKELLKIRKKQTIVFADSDFKKGDK